MRTDYYDYKTLERGRKYRHQTKVDGLEHYHFQFNCILPTLAMDRGTSEDVNQYMHIEGLVNRRVRW